MMGLVDRETLWFAVGRGWRCRAVLKGGADLLCLDLAPSLLLAVCLGPHSTHNGSDISPPTGSL